MSTLTVNAISNNAANVVAAVKFLKQVELLQIIPKCPKYETWMPSIHAGEWKFWSKQWNNLLETFILVV